MPNQWTFPEYEDKQGWRKVMGVDRAPDPMTTNYDVDLWNRRNQLRQEMGPVEPIEGGHMISAAQKLFRMMAPDADWTLRKLAGGGFANKPWSDVYASVTAWDPERPEDRLLAGMPGVGIGITRRVPTKHIKAAEHGGVGSTLLDYIRAYDPKTNKELGHISFLNPEGKAPVFQDWKTHGVDYSEPAESAARRNTPWVTKSLMEELVNALGLKRLNQLEFGTEIVPGAVPFYKSLYRRAKRIPELPDLTERLQGHIAKAEAPRPQSDISELTSWLEQPATGSAASREPMSVVDELFPYLTRPR